MPRAMDVEQVKFGLNIGGQEKKKNSDNGHNYAQCQQKASIIWSQRGDIDLG